jgi:Ca2+-binding RTX toxin-like protein
MFGCESMRFVIRTRLAVAMTALVLGGLACACPAGAVRYAGPSGAGATCSEAAPCDYETAIEGAPAGDEVILLPGDYGSSATPLSNTVSTSTANLNVHGQDGQPRPRIFSSAVFSLALYGGGQVRDIEIDNSSAGGIAFDLKDYRAERLVARTAGNQASCRLSGTTALLNSLCVATGANGGGVVTTGVLFAGPNIVTLRNVTTIASGSGTNPAGVHVESANAAGRTSELTMVNTVARGTGADVSVLKYDGQSASVIARFSNFKTTSVQGGATLTEQEGNQRMLDPVFQDTTTFRQAPGSPTVDAGQDDPDNGTADYEGNPRTIAGRTDIGADELIPPPAAVTGDASPVGNSRANLTGMVNPNAAATTYRFEYGTSNAYGASTPEKDAGAGNSATAVSAPIAGLVPGTIYHYRLVATNSSGTTAGGDRTFTSGVLQGRCANLFRGTKAGDTISGTAAGDRIDGLAGADLLKGLGGDDCLLGRAGADNLSGGNGRDNLKGGAGNDTLSGGNGMDKLQGGKGADKLTGGPGKNTYSGGTGNDKIRARNKRVDTIACGKGVDAVTADRRDKVGKDCENVKRRP